MYKIATLNNISPKGLILFDDNKYEVVDQIGESQGILVRSYKMHDMDLPDNLLAIARAGAGVNNIPLDECTKRGVVVFNTPGANANAVKELVIAGLLLSSRRIVHAIQWAESLKDENYSDAELEALIEKEKSNFAGCEIKGRTLGVIGIGAIGVIVANAASALGMHVIGYDPFVSVRAALGLSRKVELTDSFDEILRKSDYITLHVPMMDATKGLLDKKAFSMVKKGVKVLNFARGPIVDEDAIIDAINSGIVDRYVTDFPNKKLLNTKRVINIPHLGASTPESEENCAIMAVEEMMDYLEHGNITNSVNFPDCTLGKCETIARIGVFHKNIPTMIAKITNTLGALNINISNMNNRSKGEFSYMLIDLDSEITAEDLATIEAIDGIISVRIIKCN